MYKSAQPEVDMPSMRTIKLSKAIPLKGVVNKSKSGMASEYKK